MMVTKKSQIWYTTTTKLGTRSCSLIKQLIKRKTPYNQLYEIFQTWTNVTVTLKWEKHSIDLIYAKLVPKNLKNMPGYVTSTTQLCIYILLNIYIHKLGKSAYIYNKYILKSFNDDFVSL